MTGLANALNDGADDLDGIVRRLRAYEPTPSTHDGVLPGGGQLRERLEVARARGVGVRFYDRAAFEGAQAHGPRERKVDLGRIEHLHDDEHASCRGDGRNPIGDVVGEV